MSFKIACPSCEAPVLIKNPDLVGTKVECPKCKYRFKVEAPADAPADPKAKGKDAKDPKAAAAKDAGKDAKPADKAADKKADPKKKAAAGKNKKLVPIIVGAVALVVLVGVGIAVFGGSSKKQDPFAGLNRGGSGGGGGEEPPPDDGKKPPPKSGIPVSAKNTTHLLPGQTVAIYRFNLDKVRESPISTALIDDPQIRQTFHASMGFPIDDVDTYIHCFAGEQREPFGVIRTKTPTKPADVAARMNLEPKPKTVKGRELHRFRSAPFVTAVAHALSMQSLLGDLYDRVPMAPTTTTPAKPYGVCVYDTQHVLIGEYALLERFLGELDADGYPPFKTQMVANPEPPPTSPPPGDPMNPAPVAPMTPMTPAPAPPKTPAPGPGGQSFTSTDTYRTLDFPLKKALDELEADRLATPLVVYAEKFDARQYDPKLLKKDYQKLSDTLAPIAASTRYLSANVTTFTRRQLVATVRITTGSADDARTLAREQLAPGLQGVADMLKLLLTAPVEFRDYTSPDGPKYPDPTGTFPMGTYPMGTYPMGTYPMGTSPSGTYPMGTYPMGTYPMGTYPMGGKPGMGPGGSASGPPGPKGPKGGPTGPGGPGGGSDPITGDPTDPTDPTEPDPKSSELPPSYIDLVMIGNQLVVAVNLNWPPSAYRMAVAPRLEGVTNQVKGKMAVFSSEFSWHAVAASGPKALDGMKAFPRGTADRAKTDSNRLGLDYPPVQRVSFFADLLPHMGRGQLASTVNKNLAWYDEKNLPAAGAWVPELLVPYYPQSAWRANSPYAPDHVLGATNYVGVAGSGLDAARYNPADPEAAKKVGITGYGWGSKADEVTDGLANTIYLLQTPPGLQQPWLAGGGATVRGLDERDPMAGFRYTHPGQSKQGTYALMGDGSVRYVPADIDPKVLLAMSTRAGGEALADVDTHAPKVEPPKKKPAEAPKPADKKPEEKKPEDKATDPKATDPKKETAPAPTEKKEK